MKKWFLRRLSNRFLHFLARNVPGSTGIRLLLHRLRGVKIGSGVFIGDDVYLENEYPEAVEIHDGAQISVRAIILAHTRGPGKVIIEKEAYIGPNTVIVTTKGRTLRIGEGAVIGAGVVVTNSVAPHMFVASTPALAIAKALVPFTRAEKIEDFLRGLVPIRERSRDKDAKKQDDN
jgi:acetyltransferase-like isoleucine patch superfamily enzyme